MNNEALNRRIATEFMGWKQMGEPGLGEYYAHNGMNVWEDSFSPTTDMRAAYVVLEKIASKFDIEAFFRGINAGGVLYFLELRDEPCLKTISENSLPLAISKLAESIMDSPTHMELFK